MFIIRDKRNNVVYHAQETALTLGEAKTYLAGKAYAFIKLASCEQIEVDDIPEDFKLGHYTLIDSVWAKTPAGVQYDIEQDAIVAAATLQAENEANIATDSLITAVKAMSMAEIDTYVNTQFSALSSLSDSAIDSYINTNVIDLSSAKAVMVILAKDLAHTMQLLRIVTKLAVHNLKQS